jgi:hypothetical protein
MPVTRIPAGSVSFGSEIDGVRDVDLLQINGGRDVDLLQ